MEINCLPIEILLLIFSRLDFKSQLRAKNVCQLWYQLFQQLFSQQKFVLIHDTHQRRIQERVGNYNLFSLYQYRQKMSMVSLKSFNSYNHLKTEEYIRGILSSFNNLKVIYLCLFNVSQHNIYILNWITASVDSDLRQLSVICNKSLRLSFREVSPFCKKFPNLKVLQFEALDLVLCRYGLNILLESLTRLEVLIFMDSIHSYERRVGIPDSFHSPLKFNRISKSIKILKVSGDLLSSYALKEMPSLNSLLNLHICDFDELISVQLISEKFPNLSSLTLSCSFKLSFSSDAHYLMESITKLSKLKKLHLFIETENRIFNYQSLSKLKECPKLKILQFESTILNSDCIEAMAHFVPQLKKLDLTYIEFENDPEHCISWIERFENLECLKLSAIQELRDGSVNNILKKCNQLEYLDFSRSDYFSEQTVMLCIEVAKSRPHKTLTAYFAHRNKNLIQSMLTSAEVKPIPRNLVLKFPALKYI